METFETRNEAVNDMQKHGYRELAENEDYTDLTIAERREIGDVHGVPGRRGLWTWCAKRDMVD